MFETAKLKNLPLKTIVYLDGKVSEIVDTDSGMGFVELYNVQTRKDFFHSSADECLVLVEGS